MSACERCWADAAHSGDQAKAYVRLIEERACTPEQQAGPGATPCPDCGRRALHQHTGWCMACGYRPEAIQR